MFRGAFNSDMSKWNTGSIKSTKVMFNGASAFNSEIGEWDTSQVQASRGMFLNAVSFNGNVLMSVIG